MLILLSSNVLPVFTYADSWNNELAIEILTNTLSNMDNNVWNALVQNGWNDISLFKSGEEVTVTITWDDLSRNTFKYKTITIWDYTIMDRNLWAKKARDWTIWEDNLENYNTENDYYWYYYQRWNNYWFSNTTIPIAGTTIYVPDEFIPSWFSTWIYSVIKIDNNNLQPDLRWEISNNLTWRQWPCPDWWHIPSLEDWNDIYNTRKNWSWKSNRSSNESKNMAKDLLLPPAWYRDQNNNPKIWAAFLQSTTLSTNEIRLMRLNEYNVTVGALMRRHYWMPIRCVMNYDTFKVNFITNNNIYKFQDIKNWRKATVPVEPQLENWKLQWWYESNENTTFDFNNTQITDNLNLYAKWICNSWYYLNDNQDACIAKQATLIANNWTDWEMLVNEKIIELPFENTWYSFLWRNTEESGNWTRYYENDYIDVDWIILYAQREKNPWYTLNPNNWTFNNWEEEYILKSKYSVPTITASTEYKYEDEYIEYKLTWASSMHVSIFWKRTCTGWIKIYDRGINDIENLTPWYDFIFSYNSDNSDYYKNREFDIQSNTITIYTYWTTSTCPWTYYDIEIVWNWFYKFENEVKNPTYAWHEFLWWYEENSETPFDFNTPVTEDKTLYAHRKSLEKKTEETTTENVVYTNTTTVTVWNEVTEETLSWSSTLTLVAKEVEDKEVKKEEDTTKVQDSEIKVTSDKTVEYEWWLEVYLEKTENVWTENVETKRIEWTAKFSSPVAVKIPITSSAEAVKVQVKHEWEEFGYKGLTINPINSCLNWEAVNDKYNWESISVKEWAEWKYALIYTCSASTFVAYTENKKSADNTAVATPSAWGWRSINTTSNTQDQEHNSADINEQKENKASTTTSGNTVTVEENIKNYGNIKLTRWEVAVMTNILLDVFPQLVEWKHELDDVENACSNYADEQKFTKAEKKAIARLCKLSIMWIHADDNRPLEEFLVNNNTTNDEFSKVINRSISTYNEKDLSAVKDALKKLENNKDDVVFWTLYDVFMSVKNVFSN